MGKENKKKLLSLPETDLICKDMGYLSKLYHEHRANGTPYLHSTVP